jgi:hypothetical protein
MLVGKWPPVELLIAVSHVSRLFRCKGCYSKYEAKHPNLSTILVTLNGEELVGPNKLVGVKADHKDFIFGDRTWTELARVGRALGLALLALLA